jgi:hypothetical protein
VASNFSVAIDLGAAPRVLASLLRLNGYRMGLHMAGLHLKNELMQEPTQSHVGRREAYGAVFFSDAQRRGFFAMLDSGAISVPSSRTGGLQSGWYIEEDANGSVRIGNRRRYARLVVDENRQSRMMRIIGWWTIQSKIRSEMPVVRRIILGEVQKSIRG